MILTPTRRIRAYLSGAPSVQPDYNCSWVDIDTTSYVTTPDSGAGILNSTTPVEIVPVSPGGSKRQVTEISVHNRDAADITVNVETYDGNQRKLLQALLSTNWTLEWERGGTWHVYDENGIVQGTGGGGTPVTEITVEEVDGVPSYAATSKIQFDQADGFVVSQPVAGTARVDSTGTPSPDQEARLLAFWRFFNGRGL